MLLLPSHHGNAICIKDYLSSLMIGDSEQPDAPCLQPFSPAVSILSLPACSFLNTLGLVLLFTAGLSPDRYAMECKFPALLWCWEAVYLLFG